MSQKTAGRIIDSEHGLFLFTEDGIFKFNSNSNCFEEVEVKQNGGDVVQTLGGMTVDPKEEN